MIKSRAFSKPLAMLLTVAMIFSAIPIMPAQAVTLAANFTPSGIGGKTHVINTQDDWDTMSLSSGDTIELGSDVIGVLHLPQAENYSLTINGNGHTIYGLPDYDLLSGTTADTLNLVLKDVTLTSGANGSGIFVLGLSDADVTITTYGEVSISGGDGTFGDYKGMPGIEMGTIHEDDYMFYFSLNIATGSLTVQSGGGVTSYPGISLSDETRVMQTVKYGVTLNRAETGETLSLHQAGDSVHISAGSAPDGYAFKSWSATPGIRLSNTDSADTSFTMPEHPVSVTAVYEKTEHSAGQYSAGDVAVINAIIENNGLLATKDAPATWDFATWDESEPKRLDGLNLYGQGLSGALDVSGLTELTELLCGENNLTALDVTGNTKLERLHCQYNDMPLPQSEYEPREAPGITGMGTVAAWNTENAHGVLPQWPDGTGEGNDPFYYYPQNIPFDVSEIAGVTPPVVGEEPVREINEDAGERYIADITWSPAVPTTFAYGTVYTATITLAVNPGAGGGYTFNGVPEDFFTVAGAASVTNPANSCVITAVFPMTETEGGPISTDSTLRSLTVSEGTLSPTFQADTTSYAVTVANTVSSIDIAALSGSVKASVAGAGTKTLSIGENRFDIVVTAEDISATTYTVTVTREGDSYLKSLSLSEGALLPNFLPNTTSYSATVAYGVTSIDITAVPNDANASVTGTGTKSLNVGANSFDIVVTAQKSGTRTYTITVTREALAPVIITGEKARTVTYGEGGSLRLTASGTGPITWSADSLPDGITLNGDLLTVGPNVPTGTAGPSSQLGVYDITVRSSNPAGELTHDIRIIVTPQPVVHSVYIDPEKGISAQAVTVQYKYSEYSVNYWTLTPTGTDMPYFNHNQPSTEAVWEKKDDRSPGSETPSGVWISNVPSWRDVGPNGTYDIWMISFIDVLPGGFTEPRKVATFTTQGPPVFSGSSQLPAGAVGQPYTATFRMIGTEPFTWSLAADSAPLPDGLTLANGIISGTPTTEGDYTFKVVAANQYNPSNRPGFDGPQGVTDGSATKTFALTVVGGGEAAKYPVKVNNGTGSGDYEAGETVTIIADSPPEGIQFKNWFTNPEVTFVEGTSANSVTAKFTMPAKAVTVSATFENIPPTETTVTVTPAITIVRKGSSRLFAATVTGPDSPPQGVTWTVENGVAGTAITPDGTLTISKEEISTTLLVRATSTADPSKSGTATVNTAFHLHVETPGGLHQAFTSKYGSVSEAKLAALQNAMKVTGTINADDLKAIWDYSDPDHAFKDYIEYLNLSGATLDGMTAFPPGQFAGSALEEILLPSGMLAIGDNAFQNCAALTQVSLPNTLTSIGDFAFSGCTSLKSIDLSACTGMTTISNGAFHNCSGLESITLPESLTSIGNSSVFTGCTGLSEIHFPADFSTLKYTAVFSSAGSQPNFDGLAVHLHKPDGVVGVDEMTFLNAANIKIYVPAQLIDEYAADSGWQYWTQTVGNVALVFENAQRPIISNHPQGASIIQGQTHAMNVAANVLDGGSLSYQWYKDGQAIGGATGESYTTPSNLPLGSHSYHVVVTNTSNNAVVEKISTATSNTATVTVNAIPTYAITVLSAGTGATGGGSYEAGATVTISAGTAPTGMRFKNWTTASLGVTFADSTSSTTTFPMPGHAVGVTANFESIPATVTGVTVSPVTVTVQKGTTYQFSATVQGTNNPGQGVTWSVSPNTNGSSIAADGTLTLGAGETAATLSVKATSTMDGTKSGTAIVTVSDDAPPTPTVSTVTVTPAAITLNKGDSYTFSASVAGANNPSQGVTWTVTGGASGTSIINGKLTVAANETASTLTVKATSTVDTSKSGTATVTVAQPVTTHTITFDANGGSVSPTSMQTGADGKLASLPTPARSNYSFNGWFTATSSGTQVTTSTVFSESKTIYAQWTYQSSGGPSSGGGTITPPSDKIAAPTTVAGWTDAAEKVNDLKDGTAFTIDMSKNTTVSGDFLEAVAGKDAEITFDMGGGMTWTVNGTDIPKGVDLAALNLGVSTGTTFVPAEVRGIDGSISEVQLRLSHNGELPFAMTLSVKLDKANAGYFANLYYYNEATGALEFQSAVKIGTDGAAEFVFDHASDYLIVVAETSLAPEIWQNPFNDVSANHWFYDAVQYAHENGIMNGTSTTTFAPNTNLSRAMMVQILWNLEGRPAAGSASFTDVASTAWYADAVAWTASNSIVSGYGNDKFGPEESITREQMATILYRYCAYKEIELPSTRTGDFADSTAIGTWAVEAVNAMYEAEVLNGKGSNTFDPKGTATRAEIAQMMKNFMETVK